MNRWLDNSQSARPAFLAQLVAICVVLSFALGCPKSSPPDSSDEFTPDFDIPTTESSDSDTADTDRGSRGTGGVDEIGPRAADPAMATLPNSGPAAEKVLGEMVAAYKKATSYSDKGVLRVGYTVRGKPEQDRVNLMVAMSKPNKLRIQVFSGLLVSDGQKLWGLMRDAPTQLLQRDAPTTIDIRSIYPDQTLLEALAFRPTQNFSWLPLQLILLLADDPLKTLLHGADAPLLMEPSSIDDHACDRVFARRPDGTVVFWIDRQTHVLRRFEFPSEEFHRMAAAGSRAPLAEVSNVMLSAELRDASFDSPADPQLFQFEQPPDAHIVERFRPNEIDLLGRPLGEFSLTDLEGKPIRPKGLADKVVVLDFWATWCGPCRESLPEVETVYQKYRENEKVAFFAVSIDSLIDSPGSPAVTDDALRKMFKELKVTIPIARDSEGVANSIFGVSMIPTMVILGPKGVVQHRHSGAAPADALSGKIDKLLAGEDIFQERVDEYNEAYDAQMEHFEGFLQKCLDSDLYLHPAILQSQALEAEIVDRTEPATLKLTKLWSCTELAQPGNVLVIPQDEASARILVLDEGKSVAEIATAGNVVEKKSLDVPPEVPVFFLRTTVAADGKRHFVGMATGAQQLYTWDEQFHRLTSFPEDALDNPHSGIGDVRMADFDGNDSLELAVSYLGDVGVQGVSLEGKRTWANRSIMNSFRIAALAPGADGKRALLCINSQDGTLVNLDSEGKRQGEIALPERGIVWIEAADLDDDGQSNLCVLCVDSKGDLSAVGIDIAGQQLWSYPLPRGRHDPQIEAVVAGSLLAGKPDQWILAAADSSIHILDAAGSLIDTFAYGTVLTGLATAQWDGKHVLLVSTAEGVDALEVSLPK